MVYVELIELEARVRGGGGWGDELDVVGGGPGPVQSPVPAPGAGRHVTDARQFQSDLRVGEAGGGGARATVSLHTWTPRVVAAPHVRSAPDIQRNLPLQPPEVQMSPSAVMPQRPAPPLAGASVVKSQAQHLDRCCAIMTDVPTHS